MVGMDKGLNTRYLRRLRGINLEEQYKKGIDCTKRSEYYTYKNAIILPYRTTGSFCGRGGAINEQGEYIPVSSEKFCTGEYPVADVEKKQETVCYCGHLIYQWGHFLMDSVSRLWYCLDHNDEVDKYIFFVEEGNIKSLSGNYKQFFELLGIWEKIEIIDKPICYRTVIIPEKGYIGGEVFSLNQMKLFDTIALLAEKTNIDSNRAAKKIYFTRTGLKKAQKSDLGSEMLDDYFQKNGFVIISPETFSLVDLICMIRNADIVASTGGSVCHNMLFAKEGQELIILERAVLNNDYQVGINIAKKLKTTYIDANLAIYSVEIGYGPFIIAFQGELEKFTKDNNWVFPSSKYTSKRYLDKLYKRYMKQYKRNYSSRWILEDWMIPHIDYLREAYLDSEAVFHDFIYGIRPYRFIQFFQIRYIKNFIKRIIRRV